VRRHTGNGGASRVVPNVRTGSPPVLDRAQSSSKTDRVLSRSAYTTDIEGVRRSLAASIALLAASFLAGSAAARAEAPSWAEPQIAAVVDTGLMGPSVAAFRPDDSLTWSDLAVVVSSLGGSVSVVDPGRPVTMRELDAQLVTLAGLRPAARRIRAAALAAGLAPTQWLGTETVARLLGLRVNHQRAQESLELQLDQPATRAEAAYSIARILQLTDTDLEAVGQTAASFSPPTLDEWQRVVLARALRFVGSPYVWAGMSEKPQLIGGQQLPGGFDCSGFVWRVYKLQPFSGAPELAQVLRGRTTYAMSGEVPRSARISRDELQPADVVFFGSRGPRSKPADVSHMGIYVGNGWIVHSSGFGTTLTPMTGWYDTTFAWARRPLAEAGLAGSALGFASGGGRPIKASR
jgi:cell wall-associated NlpC family hydrolase